LSVSVLNMSARAIPFLLLGETRAALLRERLLQGMQQWQQHWFAEAATLDLLTQHAVDAPWPGSLSMVFVAAHEPLLQIGASAEFLARLLGLQAMSACAGPSAMPAELARSLQLEMLRHLAETWLQSSGVTAYPRADAEDDDTPSIDTQRWWHATFTQPHSFERLWLLIHPSVVAGLAPARSASATMAPVACRAAIGAEAVSVEAWLGEVRLTLRDFATLRAGDVLVLEDNQSGYLTAHDQQRIATLQPGRQRQQRAVSIDTLLQPPAASTHLHNREGR
jgi:hypothetical protein